MKTILIITLAFLLAGCCERTATDGSKTTSVSNCFMMAQDKVCNAPASVVEIADLVINLLKPIATTLEPDSAPLVALVTAQGIKDTGCAAITSLNTMIAFIQTINQTKQAKMAQAKGINIAPLQTWMISGKSIAVAPLQDWAAGKK